MQKYIAGLLLLLGSVGVYAEEFVSLLKKVEKHPSIEDVRQGFVQRASDIKALSSLKDPSLRVSALNVPKSSLSFDRTPMTSRQLMLTQKIPLTTRLNYVSDQSRYLNDAGLNQEKFQIISVKAEMWIIVARLDSLRQQISIVKESLKWIFQVDQSTQRLYSTGKTNQINLLEIKIRRAELEAQSEDLNYNILQLRSRLGFLSGSFQPVIAENIPWNKLEEKQVFKENNYREIALEKEVIAANLKLRASELSYIPDVTIGAAYALRENVDGQGDFISGFVEFSIPLWGETESKAKGARAEVTQKQSRLESYRLQKASQIHSLSKKISTLKKERQLIAQSIEFAETEQSLATKRYTLGKMSVFELLEIELKLRKKKLRQEVLQQHLREAQVEILLLKGDDLNA